MLQSCLGSLLCPPSSSAGGGGANGYPAPPPMPHLLAFCAEPARREEGATGEPGRQRKLRVSQCHLVSDPEFGLQRVPKYTGVGNQPEGTSLLMLFSYIPGKDSAAHTHPLSLF